MKKMIRNIAFVAGMSCMGATFSATFINFAPPVGVTSNDIAAAWLGTLLSYSQFVACDDTLTHAAGALDNKGFHHQGITGDADKGKNNQGLYHKATTTANSGGQVVGTLVTEFEDTLLTGYKTESFQDQVATTCGTEANIIVGVQDYENTKQDVPSYYYSTDATIGSTGENQARFVLTLGTGCQPGITDKAAIIVNFVDNTSSPASAPTNCEFAIAIPGLDSSTDLTSASDNSGKIKTGIQALFQGFGLMTDPVMLDKYVVDCTSHSATACHTN